MTQNLNEFILSIEETVSSHPKTGKYITDWIVKLPIITKKLNDFKNSLENSLENAPLLLAITELINSTKVMKELVYNDTVNEFNNVAYRSFVDAKVELKRLL